MIRPRRTGIGVDNGRPGTLITYFERNPQDKRYHTVQMGAGQTHHYAFAVADEETQFIYRERLLKAGLRVSPVMDRIYFKSIYSSDPDGHIVEIATAGPGFLYDEAVADLGTRLQLPPWLEAHRAAIETQLTPLQVRPWNMGTAVSEDSSCSQTHPLTKTSRFCTPARRWLKQKPP